MIYTVSEISKAVRIAMDLNSSSDALSLVEDVDTLSINDIIESKILEGIESVHRIAPAYLLDGGYNLCDEDEDEDDGEILRNSIYWNDSGFSGWILLPEDFMRLVVFKMDDWERAVYDAIWLDDPKYLAQSSRFGGITGTPQKPVCAIAVRPEGRVLEFYSCTSESAQLSRGVYVPYPEIDDSNGVNICKRCYKSVIYAIAALVSLTIGDTEKGMSFSELSNSALR
ncbi:MAG: hypothetical protein SNH27_05065 [Rikenellaceae bacterium]